MSKMLSKHFSLLELYRSDAATRLKINNVPNAVEEAHLQELVNKILEPLRVAIGHPIKVNSGYRGPKVNVAVGGSKTSAHLTGYAADIVCPGYGNSKKFCEYVRKFLQDNKIPFDQLIHEHNSWVHIGIRNGKGLQRKQIFTLNKSGQHPGIV